MRPTADREMMSGYLEEVVGYLPAIRDGLRRFAAAGDGTLLEEAYRFAHTIRGASALVGVAAVRAAAERLEGRVEAFADGRAEVSEDAVAAAEAVVDGIEAFLAGGIDEAGLSQVVGLLGEADGPAFDLLAPPLFDRPAADDTTDDLPTFSAAETGTNLPHVAPPPDFDLPAFPAFAAEIPPVPAFADIPPVPAFDLPQLPANEPSNELVEVFRLEAEDHLRVLTGLLPEAKRGRADADLWQEVRRAAHTLKGAAAMVGFADVTTLAHRMEDLLDQYFDGARKSSPAEIDLLLAATDAIEDAVNGRGDPSTYPALFARFGEVLAGPAAEPVIVGPAAPTPAPVVEKKEPRADRSESSVRVPVEKLAEVSKLTGEQVIARTAFEKRMGEFARLLGEFQASAARLRRASGRLDAGFEAAALGGSRNTDGFDELEFDRYTEFHLVSRELAETAADVQTLAAEFGHVFTDFDGFLTRQARLASETEDKLTRLRMVPVGTLAAKLQRTVRNAATQSGKRAEFVLDGERTGLDKTVLEAMADALLHLLRNAVDHGLEPAEVRQALGKPAAGTIRLTAEHEGSQVVLTVADDGRGIDPDAVRDAAVRRGLMTEDAAARLDSDDVFALLFAPGFSTKGEVTELSGRGVGLDVVKAKAEALKGTVAVASRPGEGTTFTIRLPMTLAVVRALLVRANQETFAVPLDAVEQIFRFEPADVERVGREPVLRVGGQTYPVVHLGRRLGLAQPAGETARPPVVLIRAGGRRAAIVVDGLAGGREVVVKRVGPHARRCPAVAGATLAGDGNVVLILNPSELVRPAADAPVSVPQAPAATATKRALSVLVVDDSPSVRRVLTGLAQRAGWSAVTAKDGMEALDILQRGQARPDVVLTDVEMPRMDGYELLATLRGQEAYRTLPVVVITSRAADKHRRKAMDLGASAYVVKPYQDDALTEVVRQLTRGRRAAVTE